MALAVRGKAKDAFTTTASPAMTYPTLAANDILIAAFVTADASNASGTPPTGWTLLNEIDVSTVYSASVFWARAGGSESGTLTWTSIFDATETGTVICFSVQDALTTGSPFAGSGTETTTSGTPKDTAAVTPSADDCLAIALMAHTQSRTFTWDGAGATIQEQYDSNTSPDGGNNPGWWVGTLLLSGAPNTSLGGDASGTCATAEFIYFIKPAAGGTAHTVNIDDTVALSDAFPITQEKVVADTLALSDALAFTRSIVIADTLAIADNASPVLTPPGGVAVVPYRTLMGVGV